MSSFDTHKDAALARLREQFEEWWDQNGHLTLGRGEHHAALMGYEAARAEAEAQPAFDKLGREITK